jgi:large subunit ribosomal protein L22
MKASVRNARISPKKLNVIAYIIIRNMTAKDALDTLRFMPKKGATIVYEVLKAAVSNATHNDSQKLEDLFASVSVTQGLVYRRINPISRGRAHRILKRTSHVDISLSVK